MRAHTRNTDPHNVFASWEHQLTTFHDVSGHRRCSAVPLVDAQHALHRATGRCISSAKAIPRSGQVAWPTGPDHWRRLRARTDRKHRSTGFFSSCRLANSFYHLELPAALFGPRVERPKKGKWGGLKSPGEYGAQSGVHTPDVTPYKRYRWGWVTI